MYAGMTSSSGLESLAARGRRISMQADAILPEDIHVPAMPVGAPRCVLLTGVTGFLGRQVLGQLLVEDDLQIVCLVRARNDGEAWSRFESVTRLMGTDQRRIAERVRIIRGDVAEHRLGLSIADYDGLCAEVEGIYHCAAEVNWVKTYRQLRRSNVLGTLELIRFACHGRGKPLTFVSSLAVCFAKKGPLQINEATDMLPWIDGMPLGYAQSKCVAEALLRDAAARGLRVSIARPGLLSGDTQTGTGNLSDIITALIGGCVELGIAPDVDWQFDSIPVDYAARAVVAFSRVRHAGLSIYHLRHSKPRHWREVVLWLNLIGYRVQLLSKEFWKEKCFGKEANREGMLYGYRLFFGGAAPANLPFETYLGPVQDTVSCVETLRLLTTMRVREPAMDALLLRLYVDYFAGAGILPSHTQKTINIRQEPLLAMRRAIDAGLRENCDEVGVTIWHEENFFSGNGILNDIASIRQGPRVGIRRYRVQHKNSAGKTTTLDLLLKTKSEDVVMQGLIAEVADLCDLTLGADIRRHGRGLGLDGTHLCEPAIYGMADSALSPYMPRCYGTVVDAKQGLWSLAIEHLSDVELMDSAGSPEAWTKLHLDCAVRDVALMQGAWFGRTDQLRLQHWLAPELVPAEVRGMTSLWQSLARFSAPWLSKWAGPSIVVIQKRCVDTIFQWWPELHAMPKTLIHNDFNPRNLSFKRSSGALQICAFDWELARIGVPQYDLAELLCFVFPRQGSSAELRGYLDLHRETFCARSGERMDAELWLNGFRLSLQRLLLQRLPLYTLVNRFKPQRFLPAVVSNWLHLYELSCALEPRLKVSH